MFERVAVGTIFNYHAVNYRNLIWKHLKMSQSPFNLDLSPHNLIFLPASEKVSPWYEIGLRESETQNNCLK